MNTINSQLLITFFNPKLHRQFLYSAPATGGESVHILTISGHATRVSDSAKGLVCLYNDDVVRICNPTTRQITTLPPTALPMNDATHYDYKVGCSMGYVASAGVHKVVRACTFTARVPLKNCVEDGKIVEVLTLGGGAWKTIPLPDEVTLMVDQDSEPRGCAVRGAVHYKGLRKNGEEEDHHVIVALDLEDEKWSVFGVPNNFSIGASLEEMDGRLGVVGEYDEFGLSLVRIYEEDGQMLRIKETRVVKKEAWFEGRRSCREKSWGAMEEDGTCTATVSLADGREVVLTGRIGGLNENGVCLDYECASENN